MHQMFDTQDEDGNSDAVHFAGGHGLLLATGTWDSGVITLQVSPDGGTTWVATGYTLNASGHKEFMAPPCQMRLSLASGGESMSVSAWLSEVPT